MKNTIKIEIIKNFMLKRGISKTKFCKMCKISPSTLNKILSNDDNFYIIALFKIAKVIKVKVYQMFN